LRIGGYQVGSKCLRTPGEVLTLSFVWSVGCCGRKEMHVSSSTSRCRSLSCCRASGMRGANRPSPAIAHCQISSSSVFFLDIGLLPCLRRLVRHHGARKGVKPGWVACQRQGLPRSHWVGRLVCCFSYLACCLSLNWPLIEQSSTLSSIFVCKLFPSS
jgi:hypothetical protein